MKIKKYFTDRDNTFMPISAKDVLPTEKGKTFRIYNLKRAIQKGIAYDKESSLEYVDETGRNRIVISKVIGMSDEHALLHNDRMIPINKIRKVVL